MRKIILSLAVIALVSAGAIQATRSYFFDDEIISGNTFSTGTVLLNRAWISNLPLTVSNMTPGVPQTRNVNLRYAGSVNADIYLGVGGASPKGADQYIADMLWITIKRGGNQIWYGKADQLSSAWLLIAQNNKYYDLNEYEVTFMLDPAFTKQGVTNTDTAFIFYAVQTGGPAPTPSEPYVYYLNTL
jgi:hypothetical protein